MCSRIKYAKKGVLHCYPKAEASQQSEQMWDTGKSNPEPQQKQ